jgi:hypothetical protein
VNIGLLFYSQQFLFFLFFFFSVLFWCSKFPLSIILVGVVLEIFDLGTTSMSKTRIDFSMSDIKKKKENVMGFSRRFS